ncbi:hypothetical protein ASPZODRAFT_160788 [Penicilliopsis zonata CBS 506.65]|uniref:RAD52 homolog n=1 Tax=Penicilliopsis zonata CBS 506.65 TaxID=1073090 RepID=A0A1L9SC05_9EURO|nr:hypothetical protein ASPZODRAFT_160788 [Penicilliopsis zonata CBS 506.65]OJJ44740.1 hypothetical protein ASPZODRAFT_160788 [Penicilliopsis zonata CBS 506.65]
MPAPGDQHRVGLQCTTTMPTLSGAINANPFEENKPRVNAYTAQEIATLQARLDKKLGPEYISSRPGAGGQKVHYLSADKCINLANEVFGFNGWSSSIQNIQIDYVEEHPQTGKIDVGLSVIVRVTLKDGTYHEDIGYGHIENCKGKAAAFEKAKKEGTTDALKRALRNFGNVLGNCVYDKDFLAKVTKLKAAPARWDVDDLHRHPDFAPVKKEPIPPKKVVADDGLPPRPTDIGRSSSTTHTSVPFDGDGEFGSDLFDEADFGVTGNGNPDEVVLDTESHKRQQPTPKNNQPGQRMNQEYSAAFQNRHSSAVITPSKPEKSWLPPMSNLSPGVRPNVASVHNRPMGQARPGPGPAPHQNLQSAKLPPQPQTSQDSWQGSNAQRTVKTEPGPQNNDNKPRSNTPQDMPPPAGSPPVPSTGFFSARAVDMLRENPHAAPQFDPHAESPSIRKTAGFDHSKSVPITRPMLSGASPASNNTRDFINPSADANRRIGVPGAGNSGIGSPMNRGPTTSSYRPLTRPNIDPKNGPSGPAVNRMMPGPQNPNGKRPPLSDVTNAGLASGINGNLPVSVSIDPKRPRLGDGSTVPAHPQQQKPGQPQPQPLPPPI